MILFDNKLILYDDEERDEKRTAIRQIFLNAGLTCEVVDEPIDLSRFLNTNVNDIDQKKL